MVTLPEATKAFLDNTVCDPTTFHPTIPDLLRFVVYTERVMGNHHPLPTVALGHVWCAGDHTEATEWPCPDYRDIAELWGASIPPPDANT